MLHDSGCLHPLSLLPSHVILAATNLSVVVCLVVQAVLAGGKVYAVDRIDVTSTPEPPGVPVTLPSLMWSEVSVQVRSDSLLQCSTPGTWHHARVPMLS